MGPTFFGPRNGSGPKRQGLTCLVSSGHAPNGSCCRSHRGHAARQEAPDAAAHHPHPAGGARRAGAQGADGGGEVIMLAAVSAGQHPGRARRVQCGDVPRPAAGLPREAEAVRAPAGTLQGPHGQGP
eukprot:4247967-Prymnesium_polylepis.1